MKHILLSFSPDWFKELEAGNTKFEYRKNFPNEPVTVYFYVSAPVKAISGCATVLDRQVLSTWLDAYKDRSPEVLHRINEYLIDCRYAMPIATFQKTNYINLETLRKTFPAFVVPRMYYFIDDSPLLPYLEKNLIHVGAPIVNNFSNISDEEICP